MEDNGDQDGCKHNLVTIINEFTLIIRFLVLRRLDPYWFHPDRYLRGQPPRG
jgi:hypothetical protein